MGNLAHLEKMGRELKCPICLSLFSSAVSLNCNHVFCNSCIVKSMKSGSNCPVCKIPFQRREVRPAPHMDNLVSIYKSMEDASGINMFMTQSALSAKSSDGKQQAEDENPDDQDPPKLSQNRAGNRRTVRGKRSWKTKSNLKNSESVSVKPSFPTKKRVQVPQCPPSETPTQPKQLPGGFIDEKSKQESTTLKEKPVLNEKGELVLSPFFWLSDKDAENLSQPSSGDQLNDIPSPNVPTFSDIKDSDDEDCSRLSPLGKVQGKSSNVADFFDSEMFEWTQRPCSPELFASPSKMQVVDSDQIDRIQVKELKEALLNKKIGEQVTAEKERSRNSRQSSGNLILLPDLPHDKTEYANHQFLCKPSNKRGRQARKIAKRKCATSHMDLVENSSANLKGSEDFYQEHGCKNSDSSMAKAGKRNKKAHLSRLATKPTCESVCILSIGAERQNEGSAEKGLTELPTSLEKNEGSDETFAQEKAKKICTEINAKNQMCRSVRSRKQKVVSMPNILDEVSEIKKQANKNTTTESSHVTVPTDDNRKVSDVKTISTKLASEAKSSDRELKFNKRVRVSSGDDSKDKEVSEIKKQANKNAPTELPLRNLPTNVSRELSGVRKRAREAKSCDRKTTKKLRVSFDDNSKDEAVIEIREGQHNVNENGNQPSEKSKGNSNARIFTDRSSTQKLPTLKNDVVLRRCDAVTSNIQCAFCLSSEESEASGEIVHYYNGKPVAADHNGGSKVIHSHRNCTEWAPNVYFEDDIAMNLEAELTRSRRIKCCCCGIKGASLGCYEKSCRKSFHVSCAKMTPECRWDSDNFVMLCPIHASSKLPNESSESEARRKKSNPRKQPGADHNKVAVKQDSNTCQDLKFCGSSKKLVLCCSTLTNAEREYVAEFEKLSGVTVLKKWDSSITHIVAPIDENGACRRTLKVLLGILEGKWILSMGWIKACMEAMKLVNEEPYEISVDIYGIRDGPRLGRLRLQNKEPKLFDGLKFYFMGDFVPSYKGYLQDLVIAAGGIVLHRKPVPESQKGLSGSPLECRTFIIFSLELPDQCHPSKKGTIFNQRQADAKSLASSAGANVVSNSWILNSVAACKLQNLS
ncbi:protein BREAST CANCER SUSCEPTIBILITY 1 homolog [Rosa rugosa]|uniref:protein BREAST CANCER SUSCEPTIBILITY 1 homolog n=1 Tax=Rosa rugosa TaxID=74645 RepID=UPI002B401729|nr:protein BREAST CANCER SUSCEPTIBILITY 1 homolog [Rosa rugosa]